MNIYHVCLNSPLTTISHLLSKLLVYWSWFRRSKTHTWKPLTHRPTPTY